MTRSAHGQPMGLFHGGERYSFPIQTIPKYATDLPSQLP